MFDVLAFAVQAHNFASGDMAAFDKPVSIGGLHEKQPPPPVQVVPVDMDGYDEDSAGPATIGVFGVNASGSISGYAAA